MKSALIIVDMVNDFVTGKFGSESAREVLKRMPKTIRNAEGKMEIVFTLDTHIENDPEFKVWGEHCLINTPGSELAAGLRDFAGYRIRKRHYDAFFDTDLDGFLRTRGVSMVFVCGVSTDICVQHTVAGAFFRNYEVYVIRNLCASIDPGRESESLSFMERNYHVRLINDSELLTEVN